MKRIPCHSRWKDNAGALLILALAFWLIAALLSL
jgi:hypothetical protein